MGCAICGNTEGNKLHEAREMMLGTRERFVYEECVECGTLALVDHPRDMSEFYPADNYYSLTPVNLPPDGRLKGAIRMARADMAVRGAPLNFAPWTNWFRGLGLRRKSAICDVGTGNGGLLFDLALNGFKNLTGVDPNTPTPGRFGPVELRKAEISDVHEKYDLVMLHHTLEHLPNGVEVLTQARDLLKPGGKCLIRIPLAGSEVWKEYGTDWVGLDPPRHLFLYTLRSFAMLADRAGLRITRTFHDAGAYSFYVSDQYKRDIAMHDPESVIVNPDLISAEQMQALERRAQAMNARGDSDGGGFVLVPR